MGISKSISYTSYRGGTESSLIRPSNDSNMKDVYIQQRQGTMRVAQMEARVAAILTKEEDRKGESFCRTEVQAFSFTSLSSAVENNPGQKIWPSVSKDSGQSQTRHTP